jgi:dipeptidyl aminopeptidase/acylaminoacyl peptidase
MHAYRLARVAAAAAAVLLAASNASPAAASAAPPRIPAEAFFDKPEIAQPRLSHDGKFLAFLGRKEKALNLYVMDLAAAKAACITNYQEVDVYDFVWVGERRLVYATANNGEALGGLHAIEVDGKVQRTLVESLPAQLERLTTYAEAGMLGAGNRQPGKHVLVSLPNTDHFVDLPDIYRVNTVSGVRVLALQNPGDFIDWHQDGKGEIRIALQLDGTTTRLLHRETETSPWKELLRTGNLTDELAPVGFNESNDELWIATNRGRNTIALRRLDTRTSALSEIVAANDRYDFGGVTTEAYTGRVLGVWTATDRWERTWLDQRAGALVARVEKLIPGSLCDIVSVSADGKVMILHVWSDRDPGRYFIHEPEKRRLEALGTACPQIDPAALVPMEPIHYTARDGLPIEGYLFRPAGVTGPAPLVVIPHGGPILRDTWGYDAEAQFLANRGYAVLMVNFRGSSGYGRGFVRAGLREWGLKMQDDITDGVEWAIAQGVADRQRIAIFGGSYGGFAALAGLAFTPDLYRCGVCYAGVADLSLLLAGLSRDDFYARELIKQLYADPKADKEYIERVSPVNHVDKIRVPLFVVHGREDQRADIKNANRLIAELKKNGKTFETMIKPDEGHGFHKRENILEFYTRLEEFLGRYLQPGAAGPN